MLKKFLSAALSQATASKQYERVENLRLGLLRHEAKVGGQVFGNLPKNHKRDFFCLDEHTWIWYEEWNENGQAKSKTIRYNVRPTGIVKAQDGHSYHLVKGEEAKRLLEAARAYKDKVESEVYQPILSSV